MKNILVPVDFSNNSHNAYLFAREIAAKLSAKLYVVNIYPGTNTERTPLEVFEDKVLGLEKQLTNFTNRFPEEGNVITKVEVEVEILSGFSAIQKIVSISNSYDLIVMGTRKSHPVSEKILGSVASGVAQKAYCPVLLIPKGVRFMGFRKMVYASNWESSKDGNILSKVANWANLFETNVDFAHVSPEYEFKNFAEVRKEIQKHLAESGSPEFNYTFSNISDESPLSGIEWYSQKTAADLIILVNRQRNLLSNLFFTSMTKEMAMNIQIPILVFHFIKEE